MPSLQAEKSGINDDTDSIEYWLNIPSPHLETSNTMFEPGNIRGRTLTSSKKPSNRDLIARISDSVLLHSWEITQILEKFSLRIREHFLENISHESLIKEYIGDVIILSNRGPVEYEQTGTNRFRMHAGTGGVVTALMSLQNHIPNITWIAAPMKDGDRAFLACKYRGEIEEEIPLGSITPRFVHLHKKEYEDYYGFANIIPWFMSHHIFDTVYEPNIDEQIWEKWRVYQKVNAAFALAAIREIKTRQEAFGYSQPVTVMIQDYQLMLAASAIKIGCPDVNLTYFHHIPWPGANYWGKILPGKMQLEIARSLLSCDLVGFQTPEDAENARSCISFILNEYKDSFPDYRIRHHKDIMIDLNTSRRTQFKDIAISISVDDVREFANSDEVLQAEQDGDAAGFFSRPYIKTIVRVDRADLTKNIYRGFMGFDRFLELYPEYIRKVQFIAQLVPTREELEAYQQYRERTEALIRHINHKYNRIAPGWTPIHAFWDDNRARAMVLYRNYDVLMVNPIIDGMNLVVQEGITANRRRGVVLLSRWAGAYRRLAEFVVPLDATDITGHATAIFQALEMSYPERTFRSEQAKRIIEEGDISKVWIPEQMKAIAWLKGKYKK